MKNSMLTRLLALVALVFVVLSTNGCAIQYANIAHAGSPAGYESYVTIGKENKVSFGVELLKGENKLDVTVTPSDPRSTVEVYDHLTQKQIVLQKNQESFVARLARVDDNVRRLSVTVTTPTFWSSVPPFSLIVSHTIETEELGVFFGTKLRQFDEGQRDLVAAATRLGAQTPSVPSPAPSAVPQQPPPPVDSPNGISMAPKVLRTPSPAPTPVAVETSPPAAPASVVEQRPIVASTVSSASRPADRNAPQAPVNYAGLNNE